jgi:hypothetical protein
MTRRISVAVLLLLCTLGAFGQNVQRGELAFNVMSYGAVPNDGLDDTGAFNAAVAAVPAWGKIYLPRGAYNINNTITIAKDRIDFEGDGPWATVIYFSPTVTDKPVFDFNKSPSPNFQSSVRGMSFSSTNTTLKKIAVRLTDVSGFVMEDVAIGPTGSWTGADSIGIQIRGRDLSTLSRISISADMPIKVEQNPNAPGTLEDFDIWHFEDMSLIAAPTKYCITVDDHASVTDFVMDGSNDFIGGFGGFYWNDTSATPPGMAYDLTIRNTRSENLTGGWAVYISTARTIRQVTLDHVKAGAGEAWKGFYIRGVRYLQLLSCQYLGTTDGVAPNNAVGLDMDGVISASFLNCFWNWGSVRNLGDMRRVFAVDQGYESEQNVYTTEYWDSALNTNIAAGSALQFGGGTAGATGANMVGGSGTLTNGSSVVLPTRLAGSKVLYIQIFTNGTGGRTEGGTALISASGVTRLNGTTGFDVVAGANRVAIDTTGGWANVVLRNTTGVDMNFGYTIWYI